MIGVRYTIGRNRGCDVVASHPMVSGYHADLLVTDYGGRKSYTFMDHSSNGTIVNGLFLHNASCYVAYGDPIVLASVYPFSWQSIPNDSAVFLQEDTKSGTSRKSWKECLTGCFSNIFDYEGTAERSEYLLGVSFLISLMVAAMAASLLLETLFGLSVVSCMLFILAFLPLFLALLSLLIRRLNDIRADGAWALLLFIPIVGLCLVIYLATVPSKSY